MGFGAVRSVSIPVGDNSRREKKKDMKTKTSFRFHILLLFFVPNAHIGAGRRTHSAHHIKFTFIQSSLEGVRGKPLCEREVPPKKSAGRRAHSAHHIKLTPIQSSLRGSKGELSAKESSPLKNIYQSQTSAITSTSARTPLGRSRTATQLLAGLLVKYLP